MIDFARIDDFFVFFLLFFFSSLWSARARGVAVLTDPGSALFGDRAGPAWFCCVLARG